MFIVVIRFEPQSRMFDIDLILFRCQYYLAVLTVKLYTIILKYMHLISLTLKESIPDICCYVNHSLIRREPLQLIENLVISS